VAKPSFVAARIVYNRLPELRGELRAAASQVVRATAAMVEIRAKDIVPVDTGNLKNSIQTTMENDLLAIVSTGTTEEDAPYAIYVEYGTRRMAARPYMRPAAEAARPAFEAAMKKLLG